MIRAGIALLLVLALAAPTHAQSAGAKPAGGGNGKRIGWTLGGIGIGFGAGMFVGLSKFDEAINSDRKVWTTSIAGGAAGGMIAFLLTRGRNRDQTSGKSRIMTFFGRADGQNRQQD